MPEICGLGEAAGNKKDSIGSINSIFKITSINEQMVLLWDIGCKTLITIAKRNKEDSLPMADHMIKHCRVGDLVKLKILLE